MGFERCPRGTRSAASSTEVLSAHTASKAVSQAAAASLPAGRLHLRPSSASALELVVKFKDPATSSGPPGPSNSTDFAW